MRVRDGGQAAQLEPPAHGNREPVMSRYFREMARVVERHGGKVEQYMGDAVMAIFGVPVLHEDDAVRAARTQPRDARACARIDG